MLIGYARVSTPDQLERKDGRKRQMTNSKIDSAKQLLTNRPLQK